MEGMKMAVMMMTDTMTIGMMRTGGDARRRGVVWRKSWFLLQTLCLCLALLIGDAMATLMSTPDPVEDFSVKLIDGSVPNTGLLLVYYQGVWGTVCDDEWDALDADVVCQQLGYPGAALASHRASTGIGDYGDYPIVLDDVACTENNTRLASCSFGKPPLEHNCMHKEDVYLLCKLPQPLDPPLYSVALRDGATPSEGRLEVYYHGVWGTVCDDMFTKTAAYVACRELGFPFAHSLLPKSAYSTGAGPMLLDDVKCSGNEQRLWDCEHREAWTHNCNERNEVVGIRCSTELSTPPGRAMRLVPRKKGLVEIFYNGIWWNVCADLQWDRRDALVACRQRGFSSGLPWRQPFCPWTATSCHAKFGEFRCQGTERTLEECKFTTEDDDQAWTCEFGFAVAECSNYEPDEEWLALRYNLTDLDMDVFNSTVVPLAKKKKYAEADVRLAGSEDDYQGRVEIYYDNNWYTVCDDSWDIKDAQVVCRQLGYPDALRALSHATPFGQGIVEILLDNVDCKGDEANLLECGHNELHVHDCRHEEDAAVICSSSANEVLATQSSDSSDLPPGAIIAISMIAAFSVVIIGGALLHYACKSCDRRIEETSPPRPRSTPMVVMMVHSTRRPGRAGTNGYGLHNSNGGRRYDSLPFTICSRTSIASSSTSPVSSPVSTNGTICEELEALGGASPPPSYEIVLRHPDAFAQMLQTEHVTPPPSYNRCISQQ